MTTGSSNPTGTAKAGAVAMVEKPEQTKLALNPGYAMQPWGLKIKRSLTFEECMHAVKVIGDIDLGSPWWQGDLLNYIETAHGEKYSQAMDADMGSYEVLRQRCSVCMRFPIERRRKERWVRFGHHYEVAKLEDKDADRLLELCAKNKWSTKDLRAEVERIKPAKSREGKALKVTFDEFWPDYRKSLDADVAGRIRPYAKKIWETALEKGKLG